MVDLEIYARYDSETDGSVCTKPYDLTLPNKAGELELGWASAQIN
jgi:hypothetical protein